MRSKLQEKAIERLENGKFTAYSGSKTAIYFIEDVEDALNYISELEEENELYRLKIGEPPLYESEIISKQVIRDKIKEYESKREKLYNKKLWNEPVDTILNNRYVNYINVLNELLEE